MPKKKRKVKLPVRKNPWEAAKWEVPDDPRMKGVIEALKKYKNKEEGLRKTGIEADAETINEALKKAAKAMETARKNPDKLKPTKEEIDLMIKGQKIKTIKSLRGRAGLGLKEALGVVDKWMKTSVVELKKGAKRMSVEEAKEVAKEVAAKTTGFDGVVFSNDEFGETGWDGKKTLKSKQKEKPKPKTEAEKRLAQVKQRRGEWAEGDFYMPREADELKDLLSQRKNVLLVGPAGCGKTEMVERVCRKANLKHSRMNLNAEITVEDFVGMKDLVGSDTVFTYGILPRAMKDGAVLLIDELDFAPPEILAVLQAVLEGKCLVITKNGGEVVEPHDNFRMVGTANTTGRGDDSGLYAGTQILNEAFLDRWHAVIAMSYLKDELEVEVVTKKTKIDKPTAERLVQFANLARGEALNTLYSTVSTRKLLAIAELLMAQFSPIRAAELALYNKVTEEDKKVLQEMWQRIFGEDHSKKDN